MTYQYFAVVNRVVDGDTLDVSVDLGFSIHAKTLLRMEGINAPELHGVSAEESLAGRAAKEYLESLVGGKKVRVTTAKAKEKYGRYMATVWLIGSGLQKSSVNQMMVEAGHAKVWDGKGEKPTV